MKLSFRDQTGIQHSIDTNVQTVVTNDNPQSIDTLLRNQHDGKVDLFLETKGNSSYWSESTPAQLRHLQFDASQLSDEQVRSFAEALKNGTVEVQDDSSFSPLRLQGLTSDLFTERADVFRGDFSPEVSLTGEEHPVFLGEDGRLTSTLGATENLNQSIQTIDRLAQSIDDVSGERNFFIEKGVPQEVMASTLEQLLSNLQQVSDSDDLTLLEQAKFRSGAATVLAEMVRSLGSTGNEGELQSAIFELYASLCMQEEIPALRESMIFNAFLMKSSLPEELREIVEELQSVIAPETPPYEKMWEDGELNISFAAGHGEGFYEGVQTFLKKEGFEVIDEGQRRSAYSFDGYSPAKPAVLQLKKEVNGEERVVNIHIRDFSNDSFKEINDDKMDIVAYLGHSNLGNNTRNSLKNGPEGTGKDKMIFLGLCAGKDNIDRVRKQYPEGQLVTTFNSSYFTTDMIEGEKVFNGGEDIRALLQIVHGSMEEKSWADINAGIREHAVNSTGFWKNHKDETLGNYLTPLEARMNARFRDLDGDGQSMLIDKHFDVDVLTVAAASDIEFTPRVSAEAGQVLNGDKLHQAAASANTNDLYNPDFKTSHKEGKVIADGYFSGQEGDPIVRFETRVEDGREMIVLQANDKYAHMSEEALRAVTMYEYFHHVSDISDPAMKTLVALTAVAASLKFDNLKSSYWRDPSVFEGIKKHYNLPEELGFDKLQETMAKEKHDYTGSRAVAEKWLKKLPTEQKELLLQKLRAEE